MARAAAAAAVLFAVVCCLLVAPAPARRPAELPPQVLPGDVDLEAAAEPLLPKPVAGGDAVERAATAVAGPEEEGPADRGSSLLCRFFWCDREEPPSLGEWARPEGTAEMERGGESRPCDDSDSDSDSDWDSDDEEDGEGGIVGWFWSLAHRF